MISEATVAKWLARQQWSVVSEASFVTRPLVHDKRGHSDSMGSEATVVSEVTLAHWLARPQWLNA